MYSFPAEVALKRSALALGVILVAIQHGALAQKPGSSDPWALLQKLTRKATYQFMLRDQHCLSGRIVRATPAEVVVTLSTPGPSGEKFRSIPRRDLLRLSSAGTILYSGRSSWSDLISLHLRQREHLKVLTPSGKILKAEPPQRTNTADPGIATDLELRVEGGAGGVQTISKVQVSRVYFVAQKPYTDGQAYALDELGPLLIFDPDAYQYWLHLEKYVDVLLYDASVPEESGVLNCSNQ